MHEYGVPSITPNDKTEDGFELHQLEEEKYSSYLDESHDDCSEHLQQSPQANL
jgi:hypothetical protein